MTIPVYARLAAKLLRREHDSLCAVPAPTAAGRADAVAAIEGALVQRGRRQRLRRTVYAGLSVAAAIGLAWFVQSRDTGRAERGSGIVVHALGAGAQVTGSGANGELTRPGARVQTPPAGRALLAFKTGTRVTLEEGGALTLVQNAAAQVLALDRGAIHADVAKLAPGRRFVVHTADAEVEVHGTSFRVSLDPVTAACGNAGRTRVAVYEGVVSVRQAGVERRIAKGEEWPLPCSQSNAAPLTKITPTATNEATQVSDQQDAGVVARAPQRAAAREVPPLSLLGTSLPGSSLTEQNDAFAAAVAAHQAGDLARAARGFEALLVRFPSGPLAESAAVQRMKVVHQFDHARAREFAREYLERYAAGFAREQARVIVTESL